MEEDTTGAFASASGPDPAVQPIGEGPRVRLVIPVHGAAPHLESCIAAAAQFGPGESMEIVVVDDGYTGSMTGLGAPTPIDLVDSPIAADAGAARNAGAVGFRGDILVFVDSDVVVEEGAIELLIRPLLDDDADATVGNYSTDVDDLTFLQQYKQLYLQHVYSRRTGYITNQYWTALSAISTKAFREIDGFRSIKGGAVGEDTLLGQRLTASGARILAVPTARGKHLKEYSLLGLVRNDFRKGMNSFDLLAASPADLSGFRHSGPRDIGAVILSWLSVPLASAMQRRGRTPWSWLLGAVAGLYLGTRVDLLQVYRRRGPRFLGRALPVMFLLDLTRGASVAAVLGTRAARQINEGRRTQTSSGTAATFTGMAL